MTRSRCGAGTLSKPLLRNRAISLPSHNPGNVNIVSDTTHLPWKTGQRWEKLSEPMATYRSPQVSNFSLVTVMEAKPSSSYFSPPSLKHTRNGVHLIFCSKLWNTLFQTHFWFFFFLIIDKFLIYNSILTGHLTEEPSQAS
jgi:hypothetical protein